ncbi:MAG: LysR family transcriptional regulator [Pikeienuella sp.]
MTPRSLRTLVAISELGTLSRAADQLGLTLSAVSMQMKALEAELGARLFDRTTRPPRLTPIGRRIAEAAREVVAAEQRLFSLAAERGLAGDWRIGFILTASVRILPNFLLRARETAPDARFAVETGLSEPLAEAVGRGRLDAAIVTRAGPAAESLRLTHLATEELVYALPPGSDGLSLRACCARLPFLQFTPDTGIGRLVARHLAREGLAPARQIVLDGIEAILESVARGIGFTALPRPDVARYAKPGTGLRPMADPPLTRDVVLATLPGSPADTMADRLADLARGP